MLAACYHPFTGFILLRELLLAISVALLNIIILLLGMLLTFVATFVLGWRHMIEMPTLQMLMMLQQTTMIGQCFCRSQTHFVM